MKHFTETQIKYLAGLIDADGSLFFHFRKYNDRFNVTLKLVLQQSMSIDHEGRFIKGLPEYMGFNQEIDLQSQKETWSDANRWTVNSMSDLNMLIPRLTKHLVIKGKHFDNLYSKYLTLHGKSVTELEMNELKEFSTNSRTDTGPLKHKNHPTWAWVAGYLDGDGCYYMRHRKKNWGVQTELMVRVVAHDNDIVGLNLLYKAFGGTVKKNNYENTHYWSRNLGNTDATFAVHFLKKVHFHSELKRHKIEQMLHHHSQRLNESKSTDCVIV